MKRLFLFTILMLSLLSCGEETKPYDKLDWDTKGADTSVGTDKDIPASDTTANDADEPVKNDHETADGIIQNDTDNPANPCDGVTCAEHAHCDASSGKAVCACDKGYHKNGNLCVPDSGETGTGTFSVSYTGPINPAGAAGSNLKKGAGTAEITHFGTSYTFTEKSVPNSTVGFPLAMVTAQQTKAVQILWIENLTTTSATRFLALTIPQTALTAGTFDLAEIKGTAMFGNISFSQSMTKIECVRSIASGGSVTITAASETTLTISAASGTLVDPSASPTTNPYPVCEN